MADLFNSDSDSDIEPASAEARGAVLDRSPLVDRGLVETALDAHVAFMSAMIEVGSELRRVEMIYEAARAKAS